MGFYRDSSSDNFVRHEIKTFQRKGDLVRSEFERLNPDGTVTKTIAYGDTKEGLRYKSYQMGVDGVVREIATEFAPPRAVTQQPPQRAPEPKPERKAYAFVVEPKSTPAPPQQDVSGSWRVKPINLNQQRAIEQPQPQSQPPPQQKVVPWWYEPLKEAFNEVIKEQQVKLEQPPPPPPPPPAPVQESYSDRRLSKRIFDLFSDDFISLKPPKTSFPRLSSWSDSFDRLEDSLFGDIITPLLEDF